MQMFKSWPVSSGPFKASARHRWIVKQHSTWEKPDPRRRFLLPPPPFGLFSSLPCVGSFFCHLDSCSQTFDHLFGWHSDKMKQSTFVFGARSLESGWYCLLKQVWVRPFFLFFTEKPTNVTQLWSHLLNLIGLQYFNIVVYIEKRRDIQCNNAQKITQDNYLWFLCFPNNSL